MVYGLYAVWKVRNEMPFLKELKSLQLISSFELLPMNQVVKLCLYLRD